MGVPKFYRWISERYPKINQIVTDNALLPEVDHLYLDLNGIIHGCTHPSHMDVSDTLSEKDMMLGIMQYLDRIITQIVKPKVSVYMAIDGVAPRAKLNQQRSRRFRSAKDLAEATKDLPPSESRALFDSNCITPGTEFLQKVSNIIQYFVRKKIKEDPLWHSLQVIFSGHDVPGEGEHKIMQHIREMRADPSYKPNTRHCIYGQDADLIMLGLVTHEPHFVILREVIDFNFQFNNKNTLKAVKKFTKESDFQLLHLSVLREYLQLEFCRDGAYDLERCIDDFVFMTFLIGNDFLPHSPTLDIGDGAFDLLFDLYREQRREWGAGDYLTLSGRIQSPERFEKFLAAVGAVENKILKEREKEHAVYAKKRRRWDQRDGKPEGPSDAELKREETGRQSDYMSMIETMMANQSLKDGNFVDGWEPVKVVGEKDFKGRYYFEKLRLTPVDKDGHWALRKSYMEGLMWCLAYYYEGCISWGWFFPYHYGPMVSDLIDVPRMFKEIHFEEGAPLTPFQQLMGCLPPASSALVPKLYRTLMISTDSPIIRFYPTDFQVDMNGKRNPWEGVNLLPFIDVALLKETIAKYCPPSKLSDAENARNTFGKVVCYRYDTSCNDTVPAPISKIGLPEITGCSSSMTVIDRQDSHGVPFQPVLRPGTQIPHPGFPSLNVIPIASVELTKIGLNCFGPSSKYPTMLLSLHEMPELPPLELLAQNVLGKSLFVNWPMMHEGQAVAVSDASQEIRLVKGQLKTKKFDDKMVDRWYADSEGMKQMYYIGNGVPGSGGVNIGEIKLRLKILPLQGMRTNPANGATKKVFGREEADVPLQLALWHAPAPDPRFIERGPMTLQERFPEASAVVLTKGKYRGSKGIVVGVADSKHVGVKVQIIPAEIPFGLAIARSVHESYLSSGDAARTLKMNPGLLGKITGRLQFEQGKFDLGLNLKSADGTCVVGFTRKRIDPSQSGKGAEKRNDWASGDSLLVIGSARHANVDLESEVRIQWEYTPQAIRLVQAYKEKFPQLFAGLKKCSDERKYDANKVFGPNGEAWLPVIREWLDTHETAKLPRSPVTSQSMSYEAVAEVQKAADVRNLALKRKGYPKESLVKIPGSALYREGSIGATDVLLASDLNNNEAPELGDRIVNLCADGVPFGARGTVVAIHEASTTGSVDIVMDEEFIGGSSLQGACSNFRGKLCPWSDLLKVTPENSAEQVDKLVPKGSGRAAVKKIISNIERQVTNDQSVTQQSSWDASVEASAVKVEASSAKITQPKAPETPEPNAVLPPSADDRNQSQPKPRSSSRSESRTESTGRGRQGAWREARGPDEKGNGFTAVKNVKSGFARWKEHVANNSSAESSVRSSNELKAILGLTPPRPSAGPGEKQPEAHLKALLGIPNDPPNSTAGDPTAGLKSILGVNAAPVAPLPTASEAEKLLQKMMASKQTVTSFAASSAPRSTTFNFTYVAEGEVVPEAPRPPPPHVMGPPYPRMHPAFPQYGITHPMPGLPIGMPMPPPYAMMPPPPPHFHQPPPPGPNPQRHQVDAPGLSATEFPPLGANPLPPPMPGPEPPKPVAPVIRTAPTAMVPSVVAGKHRR